MTMTAPGTGLPPQRVQTTRLGGDSATVSKQLGLLRDLAGNWKGTGFNLIARPDFHDKANTYLQLNQTQETLDITPIGTPIPNRGFGQDDIELFGLQYLQRIQDAATGGALHFEPGLWMTQPATTYPAETVPPGEEIIFRLGSIPHGNALLARGIASTFTGPPAVKNGTSEYAGSVWPSFNSTPFVAPTSTTDVNSPEPVISAVGSSEKATAAANNVPVPFTEYDLTIPASATNPRTPFGTNPPDPPLPASISGVPMQDVINDPAALLQAVVSQQVSAGCTFSGVALNVATQPRVTFFDKANSGDGGPTTVVSLADGGGAIGNIPFLDGEAENAQLTQGGPNAETTLVYATFWIEKVKPPNTAAFLQLQYAQLTMLEFPIFAAENPPAGTAPSVKNVGWPHVSVATLRKSFG